jgi:SAM-dependent methyltransferase
MEHLKTGYRIKPRIWHVNYIVLAKNLKVFERFGQLVKGKIGQPKILDIGCGERPFNVLFPDAFYVGTDFTMVGAQPDVLADNNFLPFKDNSFDGVIASETLEHTPDYEHAISEMVRVTRSGGYIFISVPFIFPLHYHSFDFQRITEYRFSQLFNSHEIIELEPSNTIFSTWLMVLEYALVHVLEASAFFSIVQLFLVTLINVIVILVDSVFPGFIEFLFNIPGIKRKILLRVKHPRGLNGVLTTMPCGYAFLVRVNKK